MRNVSCTMFALSFFISNSANVQDLGQMGENRQQYMKLRRLGTKVKPNSGSGILEQGRSN